MCSPDFSSSYVSKKVDDVHEHDEIKSYTVPVFNIDDVNHNPNIIVLKVH